MTKDYSKEAITYRRNARMSAHKQNLHQMFEESHTLENDIIEQLKKLKFCE